MTAPAWPPSVDIHTLFGPDLTPPGGLDWNRIQAFARFALEAFVGKIAIAFGGIEIAGWKPFDFLAEWGQARIDEASANYIAATNAQTSADYANAQLTGLLVTDVSGGVSLSSSFDGAAGSTIGGSFAQAYSGPGGGSWGLDGSGNATWNPSGGLARRCIARHTTPLAGDFQRVRLVLTSIPGADPAFGEATDWLVGRANSPADAATSGHSLVFVWITRTHIGLSCLVAGSETVFASTARTPNIGDVYDLYLGTENDDREFLVKCNGVGINPLTYTDAGAVSEMGSGQLYAGLACSVIGNVIVQQTPGLVTAWAAIDRQATTH